MRDEHIHLLKLIDESLLKRVEKDRLKYFVNSNCEINEKKNTAENTFLSIISHEIRTPLNSINGFLKLLSRTDLNPVQKRYIDNIEMSSSNLMHLLDDVLDVTKLETGQLELLESEIDFNELIAEAIAYATSPISENINLITQINRIPFYVFSDRSKLLQIISQVLIISIKSTPEGDIHIKLDVEETESENTAKIVFSVRDNGYGFSEDEIRQSAKPFTTQSKPEFIGTTLGFYLIHSIAPLLGGTFSFNSVKNSGSYFKLEFQLIRGRDISTDRVEINSENLTDKIKHLQILMAEDVEMNAKLAEELFKNCWGIDITIVKNGQKALEAVCSNKNYDIIFMDIQMPVMDGLTAVKLIREKGITVPIYALSANVFAQDIKKSLKIGMNGYLKKPISIDELTVILESVAAGNPISISYLKDSPSARERQKSITKNTVVKYFEQMFADSAKIDKLISMCIANIIKLKKQIFNEIHQNQSQNLVKSLHSLKGVLLNSGLSTEAEIIADIEKKLKHIDSIDSIKNEVCALFKSLDDFLSE